MIGFSAIGPVAGKPRSDSDMRPHVVWDPRTHAPICRFQNSFNQDNVTSRSLFAALQSFAMGGAHGVTRVLSAIGGVVGGILGAIAKAIAAFNFELN